LAIIGCNAVLATSAAILPAHFLGPAAFQVGERANVVRMRTAFPVTAVATGTADVLIGTSLAVGAAYFETDVPGPAAFLVSQGADVRRG
jgi:hypothetical protein